MKAMYPAQANSPGTELATAIDTVQDTIEVVDGSVLPDAPNLLTIGTDESAETILYTEKVGNKMMGVTRGFQGTAQSWQAGTKVARYMTAYDHDTARENIEGVYGRLDNAESASAILQPGLQVVTATKDARFKLDEIRGRTMINLLGAPGSCDGISGWNITGSVTGTLTVETTNKDQGNSLKATRTGSAGSMYVRSSVFPIDPSKHLVVLGWIKNPSPDPSTHVSVRLVANNASVSATKASYCAGGETKVVFRAFTPAELGSASVASVDTFSSTIFNNGDHYFMDSIRVYQIKAEEYADIDTLTQQELNEKYPFVPGGIIGVENPYAIATTDNLIPPFYEWSGGASKLVINDPYSVIYTRSGSGQNIFVDIPTIANNSYSFSVEADTDYSGEIQFYDDSGILSGSPVPFTDRIMFTTPSWSTRVRVVLLTRDGANGTVTFSNPMLTIGAKSNPFKPQRKSMLAFQTELHANPDDGIDPDVLLKQDGQYLKLAKWKKVVLDGSLEWILSGSFSGYKNVRFPLAGGVVGSGYVTKYDGIGLTNRGGVSSDPTAADQFNLFSNAYLYLTVANTDSGWPDSLTPSAGEIKAYFWGWTMCNVDGSVPYGGSGEKRWKAVGKTGAADTNILPTAPAPNRRPYQLLYRLAKETVEPVVSEGSLTLSEGDNVVEVGTGIVLRERATPAIAAPTTDFYINKWDIPSTHTKSKAGKILQIYKGDKEDKKWTIQPTPEDTAGNMQRALINAINYDPAAAYSITYLKRDTSPIQPIAGSLAINEKAQLSDLTAGVTEALQRVSVVEQKKAEKDAPGWIESPLLNGWARHSSENPTFRYYKDATGKVNFEAVIRSGAVVAGSQIASVPDGYKPDIMQKIACYSANGSANALGLIEFTTDGVVRIGTSGNGTFYNAILIFRGSYLAKG